MEHLKICVHFVFLFSRFKNSSTFFSEKKDKALNLFLVEFATNIKFQAILTQKLFENVSKNVICQIQDIQIFKIKGNLKNNIYL